MFIFCLVVLSHYTTGKGQVVDLLHDYLHHHHSQRVISPYPAADGFSTAYLFQGWLSILFILNNPV